MKILHLTDLHYSSEPSSKAKQQKLVNNFVNLSESEAIDFLFFTGDLTFSGKRFDDFIEAKELLLDSLASKYCINSKNIILCPGNHDVDRSVVRESVLKLMDDDLVSNRALNKFVSDENEDFQDSFRPLEHYFEFIDLAYKSEHEQCGDIYDKLYSVHIREIDNTRIGIVSINTAWRAVGNDDKNNLIFPESALLEAIGKVDGCNMKILLHHHPIKYLREFNEYEIEDLIHNNFDISFSGHMHKNTSEVTITANDGMVKVAGAATLAPGNVDIGYSIVEIDFDDFSLLRRANLFDSRNEILYPIKPKIIEIPVDEVRAKQNKFRKTVRKKYSIELENAGDLFVSSRSLDATKTFLDLYTDPVLKFKSAKEMIQSQGLESDVYIESIIKSQDNLLILGKDKCGKTSLLKKIQLELLKNVHVYGKIPYYLDLHETSSLDLVTSFSRYYEMNKSEARRAVETHEIVLLIDNFDMSKKEFLLSIKESSNWANITFRITIDQTAAIALDDFNINSKEFKKLYFHKLRKKHIRLLADKWPNLESERKEEIVDKIESVFNRMSIPFNFWTVSLFLWIFKKGFNANFQNDVGLVNLYIDSLLERDNLVQLQASFGFDKYKKYLAHLAHHLLINHQENHYSAPFLDVLNFTENYLAKNPRNDIEARKVWEYIEQKGIIKKKENDLYTFRLNGVFEYFLAHYMELNKSFRDAALDDEELYLSFSNEFEFYAGFVKSDEEFLKSIYSRTKKIFEKLNERYNDGTSIDDHLKSKIHEVNALGETIKEITDQAQQLSFDDQDALEEEAHQEFGAVDQDTDVKLKTASNIEIDNPDTLEQALTILGRVFKNIDDIDDQKIVFEIFDYIIDNACFWGFDLVDNFKKEIDAETGDGDLSDSNKTLIKLLGTFIPTLVQNTVYDVLGHRNVQALIRLRIKSLKENAKDHQYRLFVLFYLLTDISLKENKDYILESIGLITIPTLRFSILLKVNYYFAFKSNIDGKTADFLKAALQKQQLKFEPKTDLGLFHKSLKEQEKSKMHREKSDT